jgi:hemerythrin
MNSLVNLDDSTLDEEHAQMKHLIEGLLQAELTAYLPALDTLRACAAQHFAGEDADLHRMEGGNASCHIEEHATVLNSLDEVRVLLASDGIDVAAKGRLARRLASQLLCWLPNHIREMDASIAIHRFKARTGGVCVKVQKGTQLFS